MNPPFVRLGDSPIGWAMQELDTVIGRVIHLEIKHEDELPLGWSSLMTVKRTLYPSRYAIEVFPPEDRVVDKMNHYHLWVLPEGFRIPFGIHPDDQRLATEVS